MVISASDSAIIASWYKAHGDGAAGADDTATIAKYIRSHWGGSGTDQNVIDTYLAAGGTTGEKWATRINTFGVGSGTSTLPLNSRLTFLGNSKDALSFANSPRGWASVFNGGRLHCHPFNNQSRGGDAVSDYLARWASTAATKPAIIVLGDATNDIANSRTSAQVLADIDTIIGLARGIGARVVLQETTASTAIVGAGETTRVAINAGLPSRVASDVALALTTSVYDGNNGTQSYDGTHPTYEGGWAIGQAIATKLNLWTASDALQPTSGDLGATTGFGADFNPTYDMAGTAGTLLTNVSGQVATGWSVDNDSGTDIIASASKGTLNGYTAQIIDLTGTSTVSTADVRLFRSISHAIASGEFYETIAEVEITATDGASNPVGLGGFGFTGWGNLFSSSVQAATVKTMNTKFSGIMRTQGPVSGTGASASVTIAFRVNVGTVDVRMKVGRVFTRQIELSQYAAPYDQSIPGDGGATLFVKATVTGTLTVGQTLTCGSHYFSGGGLTITYQWLQDATPIGGATGRQYVIQAGDSGHTLACTITATNGLGSASYTTASTGVVP